MKKKLNKLESGAGPLEHNYYKTSPGYATETRRFFFPTNFFHYSFGPSQSERPPDGFTYNDKEFSEFFPFFFGGPARFLRQSRRERASAFSLLFRIGAGNLHAGDFFPTQPQLPFSRNEWDETENDANSASAKASANEGDDGYSRDIITGWSRRRWIMVAGIKLDLI